jgi:hypothetical protein
LSISVAPLGSFGSKFSLNTAELPKHDAEFEEITEGEELTKKEKLKTKWAALEALVGDPKRIALVAADLRYRASHRCDACSLIEQCQPHALRFKHGAQAWFCGQLAAHQTAFTGESGP